MFVELPSLLVRQAGTPATPNLSDFSNIYAMEKERKIAGYEQMTGWYDLGQLFDTGMQTLISTIIGKHSDRRIIEALSSQRRELYDYTFHYQDTEASCEIDHTRPRKEIWIDYIADTGDGWNSTYAVAYYSSQPVLPFKSDHEIHETQRGNVLVFGGDEVYPTPSRESYVRKLVFPFQTAFGDDNPAERPHVFAIPGNHDWYDSLHAFTRLFCSDLGYRRFAGWRTRQKRSYFALKLPGWWWLLGSDGQLRSDLDTPQIEYFRTITEKYMQQGDRVILCIAEPVWIQAHKYKKYGAVYDESDLLFLQHDILSKKNIDIKVFLAGDLHHYRRHEEADPEDPAAPVQKLTAGGGGAFLHPTHGEDVSMLTEDVEIPGRKKRRFRLSASFPEIETSRLLCYRNLLFLWINPWFGALTGFLYALTAWNVGSSIENYHLKGALELFFTTADAFGRNPSLVFWVVLVIGLFVFFTDTHSRIYKWAGGLTHAAAHYFLMFHLGLWCVVAVDFLLPEQPALQFICSIFLLFVLGWIGGSFLMGVYLLISLNVFGRHDAEAFSSLKIEDFKNFLRLHIAEDGTLTIYPIKIRKVPRVWRPRKEEETNSLIVPEGGSGAELIEDPILLK